MNELVSFLEASGELLFSDFVVQARSAGLRPELWVRAKHNGLLHTRIDAAGNLYIAAGAAGGE